MEDNTDMVGPKSDAVRDALTRSEQTLGATVLLVNLALGAWFIARSDFSKVLPNHRPTPSGAAAAVEPVMGLSYGAPDPRALDWTPPMAVEAARLADSRTP